MCGIVGVLATEPIEAATVVRMRDQLIHRGPDHGGLWQSVDGRVCLGHRRLAVLDLDARANQPMVSQDGRFVLTFNGEIYNFRRLRTELERRGAAFHTSSDTEVLIEAYRSWGPAMVDRLSGQFAFALWDGEGRELFCARDRAGEKPFHYAMTDGAFVFGSEIKALLAWPAMPRRVDHDAMIDFLTLNFVADPRSIWQDIRKLPPAHAMTVTFRLHQAPVVQAPRRYWSLSFGGTIEQASGERIRETLAGAADEMAIADVPLGTFLSGGVDSSAATAALSLAGHEVRSFTIGFADPAYDERPWARIVAERYHATHTERLVDAADIAPVLERAGWHFDEPFADYSLFPTYYLCREARRAITVAISGDGADELFAGYRKYQRLVRRRELRAALPVPVARAAAALTRPALGAGSRWQRTLDQYGVSAPEMLADMMCIGFPLRLLRHVARGPLAAALRHYDPHRLVEAQLREAPPAAVGLVDAMRHLDFTLTLPGDMLVKVDRASMAHSLEVRPLFLHRSMMELAARMPADSLVNRHAAKLALKDAVRPWLPDALLDRRKQGFAMPLPQWLAGDAQLARSMRETPKSAAMAELFDVTRLGNIAADHAARRSDFTSPLFSVFTLDRWFNRWAS